jgi:cation:H+ antiporter
MPIDLAAVAFGILALIWGAERVVSGAAALAYRLGMAPLLIGITIVGFGTSAPELVVAAVASFDGNPGLAIGNAIGSNIANIGLIVGATAIVTPLVVHSRALRREFPILLGVSFLTMGLVSDASLGRTKGLILLGVLIALLVWLIRTARSLRDDPLGAETNAAIPTALGISAGVFRFALGLFMLLVGSRALVWGASAIAGALGVSDVVIGLTIVAIGTSLPELATSVMSAIKKEQDLAVGNVLGSNLFNLLAVLSVPAILAPGELEPVLVWRDVPIMLGFTVAFAGMAWGFDGPARRINRLEGAALLTGFTAYLGILAMAASPAAHV